MNDHEQAVIGATEDLITSLTHGVRPIHATERIDALIRARIAAALAEYFPAGKSPPYSVPPIRDIIVEPAATRSSETLEPAGQREDRAAALRAAGLPGVGTSQPAATGVDPTNKDSNAWRAIRSYAQSVREGSYLLHDIQIIDREIAELVEAACRLGQEDMRKRRAERTATSPEHAELLLGLLPRPYADILREQRERGGGT